MKICKKSTGCLPELPGLWLNLPISQNKTNNPSVKNEGRVRYKRANFYKWIVALHLM